MNRVSKKLGTEEEDLTNTETLVNDVFAVTRSELEGDTSHPKMLANLVTKMPEEDQAGESDLHRQHFEQTLQALAFIRNHLTVVPEDRIRDKFIYLPEPIS